MYTDCVDSISGLWRPVMNSLPAAGRELDGYYVWHLKDSPTHLHVDTHTSPVHIPTPYMQHSGHAVTHSLSISAVEWLLCTVLLAGRVQQRLGPAGSLEHEVLAPDSLDPPLNTNTVRGVQAELWALARVFYVPTFVNKWGTTENLCTHVSATNWEHLEKSRTIYIHHMRLSTFTRNAITNVKYYSQPCVNVSVLRL